jgi:hypothetical protein
MRLRYLGELNISAQMLATYIKDEMDIIIDAVYHQGRNDERECAQHELGALRFDVAQMVQQTKVKLDKGPAFDKRKWHVIRDNSAKS